MKMTFPFNLAEFTFSETATRKNIDNTPGSAVEKKLKELFEIVLLPLKDYILTLPSYIGMDINILSGYRCKKLNKLIGGSETSQHCKGEAVDISISGLSSRGLFDLVVESGVAYDQLILEFPDSPTGGWVHISFRKDSNRGEKLIASKIDGKTVYSKI